MLENIDNFKDDYKELSEKEQEKFMIIVNRLLNINYLTGEKEEDLQDYYFIVNHFNLIKNYLSIIGIEISNYPDTKVIVLKSNYFETLNLTKFQSIILLIIRLLYYEKYMEISLTNQVVIQGIDIRDKYMQIGLRKDDLNTTNLAKALSIFKKSCLINYKGNDFSKDDFSIIIYSTIKYAVSVTNIKELTDRIETYKNNKEVGDSLNEEVSED